MTHNIGQPDGPAGPELLAELLARHGAALALYARQLCDAPDDVVQEALIDLARLAQRPAQPAPWLFAAVRNKALAAARAGRRRREHEAAAGSLRGGETWFEAPADDALDAQTVVSWLEELDEAAREIVVAHLWGGLTFREIGALVGASDSAAHRRYRAAIEQLQARGVDR